MRKIGMVTMFVAVAGFARTSSAATMDLVFDPTGQPPGVFSVDATADADWAVVNFGVRSGNTHVFDANESTFPASNDESPFVSTNGDVFYNNDNGIFSCTGTNDPDCYQEFVEVNVGTYTGALAAAGPYDAQTGSAGQPIFYPEGRGPFGFPAGFPDNPFTLRITIVPEPTSIVLLGASLAGLAFLRRRPA